jgi:ribosome recycling factor
MEKDILDELLAGFEKAYDSLKRELAKVRTGRANPTILDGIRVDYYGTPTPINQMAAVQVPDARLITIKPWDKTVLKLIEQAIVETDIGINPQNDGEMIRLPVPALTEERRKEYAKTARNKGEDARIAVRNARRDANDMLKELQKEGDLSEDDAKRAMEKVQTETDSAIKKVDDIIAKKEKEILEI